MKRDILLRTILLLSIACKKEEVPEKQPLQSIALGFESPLKD